MGGAGPRDAEGEATAVVGGCDADCIVEGGGGGGIVGIGCTGGVPDAGICSFLKPDTFGQADTVFCATLSLLPRGGDGASNVCVDLEGGNTAPVLSALMNGSALSGVCCNEGHHVGGGTAGSGEILGTVGVDEPLWVGPGFSGLLLERYLADAIVDGRDNLASEPDD